MPLIDQVLSPWINLDTQIEFNQATLDSRSVTAGALFVAVVGHQLDGRKFIDSAIANGAVAVLTEAETAKQLPSRDGVVVIGLPQLNDKLSHIAMRVYPAAATPSVIGVTGTNGKTTVSQLCAQLLTTIGLRAGVMGTVGNGLWGELKPSINTTSDAFTVSKTVAQQALSGAQTVALEVSSHGLSQHRIKALPIDVAVYTNLSRDHLDYHGDMESYAAAKRALFNHTGVTHAVLNLDDQYGALWHRQLQDKVNTIGYSIDGAQCRGDFVQATAIQYHANGVNATIHSSFGDGQLHSPLLGQFNLANVLAAVAALLAQGHQLATVLSAVTSLKPADGRMECFTAVGKPTLVVDYAHTPDAIEQALTALRRHCSGKLWCLFGCGGERDKGKRPLMTAAAARSADYLVITADNPRSEQFDDISTDMQRGVDVTPRLIEADRASAVRQTFTMASANDVILLAGKGHEDYQIVAGERLNYNERALAQQLCQESS
ncbi:UDP-N-acetylmuramoyl-L-alanyl-D-glutamate--2,6-diaminopimelate ligase [Ferrimonas lipolytica]|uniref:UDP-N-acetylmuramoyl-L-alanyl-D-glutamate--2,6-diaminopimelate ligase n=1 Tax=Ferrimonas lipolytica TaxID=2724191 RepID=A0A6H1UI76_9GAMM|nr:UDP-N-acetylmuramoyl-L-alanyl-D-glutamate--2,6-diaminopimelate ligase [Ferrimonas lipolytica]QIZ78528.1 UDP-N-acetylmuramoyl-L-alanyl-D-glutamate--2,6-diaminopimelate ligase [Ferrimonas lipolytica]